MKSELKKMYRFYFNGFFKLAKSTYKDSSMIKIYMLKPGRLNSEYKFIYLNE